MKIAFILPKIINQGPVIVAKDIIDNIKDKVELIDVYYFDDVKEIDFDCNLYKISFFDKIDFDKYDIVHSHMLRPDLYVWFHRKKNNYKVKFISTLHQNIYFVLKDKYRKVGAFIFEKIWLSALKKQDVVIVLSNVMRVYYSNKAKLNFKIIHNGRSVSYSEIENDEDVALVKLIKRKYITLVSHSGITRGKGLHQIIKSLIVLEDFAFVIIGNGPELENLKKLAQVLGVADRCFFLGYKKDAVSYLKHFDLYVMSSYSEGFPLGLLEAGLNKLPVICSDIPIFRELFTEEEVCFFKLDEVNSLVEAIKLCYENKEVLSSSIFHLIEEKYSVNKMGDNYMELYQSEW